VESAGTSLLLPKRPDGVELSAFPTSKKESRWPFYLHPRAPRATRQQAYEGHAWLAGSPWDLRLKLRFTRSSDGQRRFDEISELRVILGHLDEGLPFGIWRSITPIQGALVTKAKRSWANICVRILHHRQRHFHTPALIDVMAEVGAEPRSVLVDYLSRIWSRPETVRAGWHERTGPAEIARRNAQGLFRSRTRPSKLSPTCLRFAGDARSAVGFAVGEVAAVSQSVLRHSSRCPRIILRQPNHRGHLQPAKSAIRKAGLFYFVWVMFSYCTGGPFGLGT